MNYKPYGKTWSMRVPKIVTDILDEMKRRDLCENYSHGVRVALREYAKNHEIQVVESIT
jgi:hypothetical protein